MATLTIPRQRGGQPGQRRAKDLTGLKFGMLTAIERAPGLIGTSAVWQCRCDCGNTINVAAPLLSAKRGKGHCGCAPAQRAKRDGREYRIWCDMRNRCNNPNNKRYPRYGARGIRVCERWDSFGAFLADMGPCPSGMSIERDDNDGAYCKANCRWATLREQSRNTSRNRMLTFAGKTMCLADWAEHTGLASDTIAQRLDLHGWTLERALTAPSQFADRVKAAQPSQ